MATKAVILINPSKKWSRSCLLGESRGKCKKKLTRRISSRPLRASNRYTTPEKTALAQQVRPSRQPTKTNPKWAARSPQANQRNSFMTWTYNRCQRDAMRTSKSSGRPLLEVSRGLRTWGRRARIQIMPILFWEASRGSTVLVSSIMYDLSSLWEVKVSHKVVVE